VKINPKKLASAMAQKGVDASQLAAAMAEPGISAKDLESAINNWVGGRDHPRCKATTIRRIAQILGVRIADITKFTCQFRNHRGSPRKAKLLIDLIRGKSVVDAENQLSFTTKRAALDIKRALKAASIDAEQHGEVNYDKLFVSEAMVDQGTVMKRFQPKDRGRAHRILKRMSHIKIALVQKD
jgi:large subunit ribosomal protein L22